MSKGKLVNGVMEFNVRMNPYTPHSADLNPKKKIQQINDLLQTKSPKFCIIRGEGIGDVIMTTPAIHALRELFDNNCEITYATNTKYLDGALVNVLKYNEDIDYIIDRDNIDEADYSSVISLHCPCMIHEVAGARPPNRIDLFANHMGLKLKDPVPRYFVTEEEYKEGEDFIYSKGVSSKKTILVNLFSSSAQRTITNDTVRNALIKLYNDHKIHSLIVRHSSDAHTGLPWDNIPGSVIVNDKNTRELAAIMCHIDLLLCPDSALLHVGGALGIPTVSLFGPTDPAARINYYPKAIAIWEGETLPGHPHWYQPCPQGGLCWRLITDDQIVNTCVSHINSTGKVDKSFILNRQ